MEGDVTKVLSLRVPDELAAWADEYAQTRGVTRQALLVEGLLSFKEDCEAGVPEIRQLARAQSSVKAEPSKGVGVCPARGDGGGHVWAHPREDALRSCVYGCGAHGREPAQGAVPGYTGPQGGGHFAEATAARAELFSRLRQPSSVRAWGKGK